MGEPPSHGVTDDALGTALSAERVVHACHDMALEHAAVGLQALPDRDEAELVQAGERG